ncbi:MAG: FKBP-type peptidyl-prolyl cis-trans isomerase [Bacteroidota bacterium]|nr:FKBP-type peptidyl-prolyl cis-trans isomerase [Bacteroidota bacterium]
MKKTFLFFVFGLFLLPAISQVKKKTTTVAKPAAKKAIAKPAVTNLLKTKEDSVSYSIGLRIAQNLESQGLEKINLELLKKAMNDVKLKKPVLLPEADVASCLNTFQQEVNAKREAARAKEVAEKGSKNRQEGAAFLAANGKRQGVVTLPSGLEYEVIKKGSDSTRPKLSSNVTCHYTGTLLNGTKFDSSVDRGTPATFQLGNVIRGWQEALQLMTVGSKWKLFIPADLAYGDNAPPNIGPGATLIFEVELLGVSN